MEKFDKCIFHNKKASEINQAGAFKNFSDIGLAYYRMGINENNPKHFDQAFAYC